MTQGGGWLSVGEAAAAAGVSRQAVYGWIDGGRVRAWPGDGVTWIEAGDLARLLAARRAAVAAGVHVGTLLRWAEEAEAGRS